MTAAAATSATIALAAKTRRYVILSAANRESKRATAGVTSVASTESPFECSVRLSEGQGYEPRAGQRDRADVERTTVARRVSVVHSRARSRATRNRSRR